MKKLLPKTVNNPQGFTLIELMVAITIVAIMAVAGIIVYTQVQQNARDARRREDLAAIVTAIEGAKDPVSGNYADVPTSSLIGGAFPRDPLNAAYCFSNNATTTPPANPTTWTDRTACPVNYRAILPSTVGGAGTVSWTVCALLERGTNPGNIICRNNSQ